ncbi:MAG: hypothetical protein JST00_14255 [Deltaproteobacteria bacterium]|nr:hypothetical protein [Deltaproteobacteria bacterium]
MKLVAMACSVLVTCALAGCSGTDEDDAAAASEAALSDPRVDPRFGERGLARSADLASESKTAFAYDDAGRFLLFNGRYDDRGVLRAERRNADGSLDRTFARTPIKVLLAPESGTIEALALADGSTILATSALCALSTCPYDDDGPGRVRRFVIKLSPSGEVATSFGGGKGFVEIDSPQRGLGTYPIHLARTPKNEIVVVADRDRSEVEVTWLDANGRVLRSHRASGLDGATQAVAASSDSAYLARVGKPIDRIGFVAGVDRATGRVARGNASFQNRASSLSPIHGISVERSAVWVVGSAPQEGSVGPTRAAVRKLGLDLFLDRSFGTGGEKIFDIGKGKGGELTEIRTLADGRVFLAGTIELAGAYPNGPGIVPGDDRELGFVVLKPNGAYDTSVADRGTFLVHAGSTDERVTAIGVGPKGVFAAGISGKAPVATRLLLP